MSGRAVALVIAMLLLSGAPARAAQESETPRQVFERRILPIFKSPNPSSCTQCHLAAVDLKNYILPSHEKTFLSLRDQGLIDLDRPEASKILSLIRMGSEGRASPVHEKVRRAELEAFTAWLEACCKDETLRKAPKLAEGEMARPARPDAVIRHARKDRLLESFENNVWALRFRCMNCHTEGSEPNNKYRREFGERVAWVKGDAAATMNYLLASKLIDRKTPERSLLLLKPLGAVEHKGGKKFQPGDQGYRAFRTWLEDYVRTVRDEYRTDADLPAREVVERFGTDVWLKLANTPEDWGDRLVRVSVYAWDARQKDWEKSPIATSDRAVWGKGHLWQHNLTLLADRGSERARLWKEGRPTLPPGRYLVKVHVDRDGRLAKDWKADWREEDCAGSAAFETRWQPGYGAMTALDASRVRR
jgi:hypothetical protein